MKTIIYILRVSSILILSFGMLSSFGRGGVTSASVRPPNKLDLPRRGIISLRQSTDNQGRAVRDPIFLAVEQVDANLNRPDSPVPQDLKTFAEAYITHILAFTNYGRSSIEAQTNAFLAYQLVQSRNWDTATQTTLMQLTGRIAEKLAKSEIVVTVKNQGERFTANPVLAEAAHNSALTTSVREVREINGKPGWTVNELKSWKEEAYTNCRMPGV